MNRLAISIQSLGTSPRSAVISVAAVSIGHVNREVGQLTHLLHDVVQGRPITVSGIQTKCYYAAFGVHARQMVEFKHCTADPAVVEAWGRLPELAAAAFHDDDQEWLETISDVGNSMSDAHEVWVLEKHHFIPIWENWCKQHVMPHRMLDTSFRDAETLFSLYPDERGKDFARQQHALAYALELASRVEACLELHAQLAHN